MQWSFGGDFIDRGRPWGRDRLPCDDRLATSIIKPNSWPFIPLNWIYSFALLSPRIIKYGLWNLKNLKNSFPLLLELLLKPNFSIRASWWILYRRLCRSFPNQRILHFHFCSSVSLDFSSTEITAGEPMQAILVTDANSDTNSWWWNWSWDLSCSPKDFSGSSSSHPVGDQRRDTGAGPWWPLRYPSGCHWLSQSEQCWPQGSLDDACWKGPSISQFGSQEVINICNNLLPLLAVFLHRMDCKIKLGTSYLYFLRLRVSWSYEILLLWNYGILMKQVNEQGSHDGSNVANISWFLIDLADQYLIGRIFFQGSPCWMI